MLPGRWFRTALPIRLRLTIAFASAMVLVLVGAGSFVYLRLRADLNDSVDNTLRARWAAAAGLLGESGSIRGFPLEDSEESFIQVLDQQGRVLDVAGLARQAAMTVSELETAQSSNYWSEHPIAGIDGTVRILAGALTNDTGRLMLVTGQSLTNRDEALADLLASFAVGGPVAVLAASLAGYWLASTGLAPVESMRRTAAAISWGGGGQRLPIPAARDEIRSLGETINEMIERLDRSYERERRFVADASHELRTPIAVMKTELEAALQTGGYTPEVGESLKAALEEGDALAQLAEDLLVLALASETGLALVKEPIGIDTLLDTVRLRFVNRAAQQERTIAIEVDGDDAVVVDPLRVQQALGNLVDNALRHGDGNITLRGSIDLDRILLEVSDTGPGFPTELSGRAFERFSRGDAARTRGGSGLGLAIVKAVAEAHGGDVRVVERPGATVRICLPR
jgi:signal transduction histidine kinase